MTKNRENGIKSTKKKKQKKRWMTKNRENGIKSAKKKSEGKVG